ncbi:Pepco domain-containing protein [Amycolatopsis azurea]|uniref:Pepco domain-containing protein n=1 Tax=Amycolatopsis azurea DSM 43854 TaxID=1238180 RepID=A0ABX3J4J3_9PSEU|nr:hypothetical protein [Amycolatopsis azurea]OOC01938.1 hypothetical protein B0293_37255 [Amycolatopsis azurea DSM 43854]
MPDETTADDSIRVFGLEDDEDRSLFRRANDFAYGRESVKIEVLQARVAGFLEAMQAVIDKAPEPQKGFALDQIQVAVEISAKGHLSLLGTGGELAGKGGLTFTFKRKT